MHSLHRRVADPADFSSARGRGSITGTDAVNAGLRGRGVVEHAGASRGVQRDVRQARVLQRDIRRAVDLYLTMSAAKNEFANPGPTTADDLRAGITDHLDKVSRLPDAPG